MSCASHGHDKRTFPGADISNPRIQLAINVKTLPQAFFTWGSQLVRYVTPWHGRGYDFARTFREKFDYISPTWYQLKGEPVGPGPEGGTTRVLFRLAGGHDFDGAWVADVRDGVNGEGAAVGGSITKAR